MSDETASSSITASHLLNPLPLPPLNDLTCLVTGSTSGIGRQTARQLAEGGAHVVMAVRNTKAARELIQLWQNEWSEAQKFSEDGYEQHMQVNHLAPSLLSVLLLPSLIRGSPSRIINVNSVMHSVGFVDPDDMNVVSGSRKYSSVVGYSSSKLAQIMFSSILFKKLPLETGVSVICLSPGVVLTNVARDLPRFLQALYAVIPYFIFSPQEGCRCSLFSATDPQIPEYWETLKNDDWPVCPFISQDCRPTNPSEEAHNTETSHRVWEKTLELVGLSLDAVEKLVEGESVKCRYGSQDE
ncbi:NAD(P)-binding Rossmann-fold superfamily protein [Raphanus sativus]|nr:NAD(P)-binding Rossmann-fold superfamily protein [Raphanus sativus]